MIKVTLSAALIILVFISPEVITGYCGLELMVDLPALQLLKLQYSPGQ